MYSRFEEKMETDVLVIGAGLAGVSAAITAARQGCRVILLEKFRTLGGNGGPEVGVHPSGAHRFHPYAAETGVMEELIENAAWMGAKTITYEHHYNMSQLWDTVMSDTLEKAGVTVLRCHYAKDCITENGKIKKVIAEDIATYHTREITVNYTVIDSSGDGNISLDAGARFRMGRESKSTYNERTAPEKADNITMGSSLVAYVRESKNQIDFIKPDGTPDYYPGYEHSPDDFPKGGESVFVFPTETGGEDDADTIEDDHEIYKTLLNQLYAWWDRGKKEYKNNKNWELVWVSPRVARRESRRFVGDYTLTQNDVEQGKIFDDAVGFGGFAEDLHYPRKGHEKYIEICYIAIPPLYSIPYRSLYSADIDNLFFGSRLCSVSHLAHGTVRLQRTLSTVGMACGVASGLCKKYNCTPREIYQNHIDELQQTMLKQDITVMGKKNKDENDLALKANVNADSFVPFGVDKSDGFLPLDRNRALMLWDWADRLDSFSCLLKNDTEDEKEITAVLKVYVPIQKRKNNTDTKKFEYFEKSNQMEWGVDDTADRFAEVKNVSIKVPANYCGWCEIPFDLKLSQKDIYNDDVRYAVELPATDGISWAYSKKSFDFCRRAEINKGDKEYKTFYEGYCFNMSPSPKYGEPENVTNGISRRWATNPVNMWIAKENCPQSITLSWDKPTEFNTVNITFDSLSRVFSDMPFDCNKRVSELLVKHYTIEAINGDKKTVVYEKNDNHNRFNSISFNTVTAQKLIINILETWGKSTARIYEIRVYNNK